MARPLPVECLLVDMPAAFPVDLTFTFFADSTVRHFAIEHREDIVEIQVCILFRLNAGETLMRYRYVLFLVGCIEDMHEMQVCIMFRWNPEETPMRYWYVSL